MQTAQLRQADLNLLVVFTVLAEERNVSRAAARLGLSQPAVSRALRRTREMFRDDLLVRASAGFEPTPLGRRLLREMEVMLPRLDRLLSGAGFDAALEQVTFRLASTDYATHVICPLLCRGFMQEPSKISWEFTPWTDSVFEALERGQTDLLLNADDAQAPAHLVRETLFEEELVCVVARDHPFGKRLTLVRYLEARHIGVSTHGGVQSLPERNLAQAGARRRFALRVPYFSAAIHAVAETPFIATVPRRIALNQAKRPGLAIVKAPRELARFHYQMVWHPRMNTDAAHVWLRSVLRQIGERLRAESKSPGR